MCSRVRMQASVRSMARTLTRKCTASNDVASRYKGITYTEWEKLEAAFIKLDAEVTRNPKDYLEWRTVNAEMSDMWITPLAIFTPRSLLVWMR